VQPQGWCKTIEGLEEDQRQAHQVALFSEARPAPTLDPATVQVKLRELQLHRPRQWGACWLAGELWDQGALAAFWSDRLGCSRQGTRWLNVFKTRVCYPLIEPGSEWGLHRKGLEQSAMGDLLGEDFTLMQKDKLYRCLDKLLAHKRDFFSCLKGRWQLLFHARFDSLLYDLTSTALRPRRKGCAATATAVINALSASTWGLP
jgi:hypothetical protein